MKTVTLRNVERGQVREQPTQHWIGDSKMNHQMAMDFSARPAFDGATYDAVQDGARLHTQLRAVRDLMADGAWRSLHTIGECCGYPEASVSARLRDLRKPRFGAYLVERERVLYGCGTYQYRVRAAQAQTLEVA